MKKTKLWCARALTGAALMAALLFLTACPDPGGSPSGPTAPAAPGTPVLTAGDTRIEVSWAAVNGAAAYEVWYGTDATTGTKLATDATGTSASITGLTNGTAYHVRLKAKNSAGTSNFGPAAQAVPVAAQTAPAAPGAPTLTAGDTRIEVSWTAVNGAAAYEVWYGTDATTGTKLATDATGTSASITGLVNGTTYHVRLKAKNSAGTSDFGPTAQVAPVAAQTAPAAPGTPALTAGDTRIEVSWTAVNGAAAYEVWYGTDATTGTKLATDPTGTSASITGLTNGTTYHVRLKAKNSAGTSDFGPTAQAAPVAAQTPPAAPGTPVLTAGDTRIEVSWAAVSGAAAYEVWYGTDATTGTKLGTDATGTSASITGLTNGTAYHVRLKAKNAAGVSDFGPTAQATPAVLQTAPAAPGAPTLAADNQSITVSWTAVNGAAAYEVWYGTTADTETKLATDPTGTSASITGLVNGTTYHVRLKAKNAAGASDFGPAAQATPALAQTAPAAPAAPALTAGDGEISVSWNTVTGASTYAVYYGQVNNTGNVTLWLDNTGTTSTLITGLTNGTTYYVFVRAQNSAGVSPFSAGASAAPLALPPAAPGAPSLTADNRSINVSWTAVAKATAYEVWYGTTAETGTKLETDPTGTSAVITGLTNGTAYHVRLKAKNAVGASGFGPAAQATPEAPDNTGTAAITVTAPPEFGGEPSNLVQSGTVTLSASGANSHPKTLTFTLQNTGGLTSPAYCWLFDGKETGTDASLTINAETGGYEKGVHYLSVEIRAGEAAWSNEIKVAIVD